MNIWYINGAQLDKLDKPVESTAGTTTFEKKLIKKIQGLKQDSMERMRTIYDYNDDKQITLLLKIYDDASHNRMVIIAKKEYKLCKFFVKYYDDFDTITMINYKYVFTRRKIINGYIIQWTKIADSS